MGAIGFFLCIAIVILIGALSVATDDSMPTWMRAIFFIALFSSIIFISIGSEEKIQSQKEECKRTGGEYMRIYRGSDMCILSGSISKVYP